MGDYKNFSGLGSFRARILSWLVPIFGVLYAGVGLVDLYQQRRLAEEEISERVKSTAENLAYSSRLAVLTEDKWLLEAAVESARGAADFAYVVIFGERWTPLVQAAGKNFDLANAKFQFEDHRKELLLSGREKFLSTYLVVNDIRYLEYSVPIATLPPSSVPFELLVDSVQTARIAKSAEKIIGAVSLGFSMNRIDSNTASFLEWRLWSVVVFLCLSTVAIYILSDRITRPLKQLTAQAKRVSQGLWSQPIGVETRDEIGELAIAFNEMARSLSGVYSSLEQKVAERTNELRAANIKLAEASQHKSRFLANVNHELRTPLSSIIGYARLLRRETVGQISSLQRENLNDLLRNAERLLGMIDSLLDFAKIESGKMEVQVEPVRVDELIHSAASSIEPMLDPRAVRLVRDVPAATLLHTDPEKLRQIVINLMGNAVKFTERGEIRVSAWQVNGDFKLAVADSGIGIESADLSRIFEEFDRGRIPSTGQYHGTGLGLAIVKRLVDLLGGTVDVVSEVGKGSTFTVTLPVTHAEGVVC